MDAFALLDRLDGGDEDVVLSPYGVARALDVVRRGASGRTHAALDAVLGPDETPEVKADGLLLAQAAWLAPGYEPGPALTLETGPLEVAAINAWANERTHGMIPAIVDRFGPDEILAITDAIYLDAKWGKPFARVGVRPFAGAGEVAMMSVDGGFEHTATGRPAALRRRRAALRRGARRHAAHSRLVGRDRHGRAAGLRRRVAPRPRRAAERARPRARVRAGDGPRGARHGSRARRRSGGSSSAPASTSTRRARAPRR